MKIVFLLRMPSLFSYYETVFIELLKNNNELILLLNKESSKNYELTIIDNFCKIHNNFTRKWMVERKTFSLKYVHLLRSVINFGSYASRKDQSVHYLQRYEKQLPNYIKHRKIFKWIIGKKLLFIFFKSIDKYFLAEYYIKEHLKNLTPDIVVTSPHNKTPNNAVELDYIKAAKSLSIPTTIITLSWDNLTTKGLINVVPDLFMIWNESQKENAMEIHGIPERNILITGAPVFDKWFNYYNTNNRIDKKRKFFQTTGLDSDKPFVLYLGSSINITSDESWIINKLSESIGSHPDSSIKQYQILLRPHPANYNYIKNIKSKRVKIYPKKGALPEDEKSFMFFYYSLKYSLCTIGINTSAMLEAIIFNKPCISIVDDYYRETQTSTLHFQDLLKANVLDQAENVEDVIKLIKLYESGEDNKNKNRMDFVRNFVRPHSISISAGKITSEAIQMCGKGINLKKINKTISDIFVE